MAADPTALLLAVAADLARDRRDGCWITGEEVDLLSDVFADAARPDRTPLMAALEALASQMAAERRVVVGESMTEPTAEEATR